MAQKRKILFRSIVIAGIVFAILCGVYYAIPFYLEKKLLPGIAKSMGFDRATCDVRKFNLGGLDLASFEWGTKATPVLSFDSARIDYSLPGLMKKHIRKIFISGVKIKAEYKGGKIVLPGIDLDTIFKGSSDTPKNNAQPWTPPVSFDMVEIRNATIVVKSGYTTSRIPFNLKMKPVVTKEKARTSEYDIQIWSHPRLRNLVPGLKFSTQVNMHGTYDLQSNGLSLQLIFDDLDIDYNGYKIQNSPGDVPLVIEVAKTGDTVRAHFSRFCMLSPFPIEMSMDQNTDFNLHLSEEGVSLQGKMNVGLNKELMDKSGFWLKLTNSESLPLTFKGKKTKEDWYFTVNSQGTREPIQFQGSTEKIGMNPNVFSIGVKGKGTKGSVQYAMKISRIKYDSASMFLNIPDFWLYGQSLIDTTQYPTIKAFAKFSDAEFTTGSLHTEKIQAKVPFQWPFPSTKKEEVVYRNDEQSYFNVGVVKYANLELGAISATPYQNGLDVLFAGQYKDLIPDFLMNFSGKVGINDNNNLLAHIDFNVAEPEKVVKVELEKFSDKLAGMSFEGNVVLQGTCDMLGSTITSSGFMAMHNAKIENAEKKMVFEGINMDLTMPDLFKFQSEPVQILKFKRFAWGDIEMTDGEMELEIESPASVFIEKCGLSWCGGHVYTHGLHLDSAKSGLELTLYCDRLKLANIFKQFNLGSAEGEGAVNGRIPVSYRDGKIKVLDGFLYSTPGEGGTLNFSADTLIPGAPGLQQTIQMQIAQEALKNFTYNWAKLSLLSQGDDLLIHMQMDGRPGDLLPFSFSKSMGLVKVEGKPRAHFQGILFNLNFKLPLEKMLYYGSSLSELMQQGK